MSNYTRPLKIDPSRKYWAVSMYETIGTVIIECITHDIPADDAPDACQKAIVRYMQKNGVQSQPRLKWVELEPYSRPIVI